jgi:hypothetical protein
MNVCLGGSITSLITLTATGATNGLNLCSINGTCTNKTNICSGIFTTCTYNPATAFCGCIANVGEIVLTSKNPSTCNYVDLTPSFGVLGNSSNFICTTAANIVIYNMAGTTCLNTFTAGGTQMQAFSADPIASKFAMTTWSSVTPSVCLAAANGTCSVEMCIMPNSLTVNGCTTFAGIQYIDDYCANYIARSLVDCGYVNTKFAPKANPIFTGILCTTGIVCLTGIGTKTTETCVVYIDTAGKLSSGTVSGGGGISAASNGLTTNGTTVCLGGVLTQTTSIIGAFTLNICGAAKLSTTCGYQISGNTILRTSTGAIDSIYIGKSAGSNGVGSFNIGIGCLASSSINTGTNNIAIGCQALYSNISGGFNIAIGDQAMCMTTTSQNIAIGFQSLYRNAVGNYNIALGCQALYYECGSENIGIGIKAGMGNYTGARNVFIGRCVGLSETGSDKLHIGNCGVCTLICGDFSACSVKICGSLEASKAIIPSSGADASYPNNSIYFSTTSSKLVYKDIGGVVHDLY